MKISRTINVYTEVPSELTSQGEKKEARVALSFNIYVPKILEKKAHKWIDKQADELADVFKKFVKKECKKLLGKDE